MKKGLLLIAIVAMLLPMSMMAQTTLVLDKESGLEYLDDGDGRLYIDVGSTAITTIKGTPSNQYFVSDGGLRANWRQNIPDERLQNKAKWYKEYLDEIKTLDIANNGPTTFKGIEYSYGHMVELLEDVWQFVWGNTEYSNKNLLLARKTIQSTP